MVDAKAADTVISSLKNIGSDAYLIPSATDAGTRLIGRAIKNRGGYFFTQERWSFVDSVVNGTFDCARFLSRRAPLLRQLRTEFPGTFRGLHLLDEPVFADLPLLGAMARCVRGDPTLAGLDLYLNLLPLVTIPSGFHSKDNISYTSPAALGIDCGSGDLIHPSWLLGHQQLYASYVDQAMAQVRPEFLAFDFYPYVAAWGQSCVGASRVALTQNSRFIESRTGTKTEAVFYLQNFCGTSGQGFLCTPAVWLNWSSALAMASGVRRFAYFASNDFFDANQYFNGLLNTWNVPTGLYSEADAWNRANARIRGILAASNFVSFVSPKIGILSGGVVGNLDALGALGGDLSSGEYAGVDGSRYLLVSPNQLVAPGIWTRVHLNSWFSKIDQYNPRTDSWTDVRPGGTAANHLAIWFNQEQQILIRLR